MAEQTIDMQKHFAGDGERDPDITTVSGPDGVFISCTGAWVVLRLHKVVAKLREPSLLAARPVAIDCTAISSLDTAGALLLERLRCGYSGKPTMRLKDRRQQDLFATVAPGACLPEPLEPDSPPPFVQFLNTLGGTIITQFHQTKSLINFLGAFLLSLVGLLRHPGRLRLTSLAYHMELVGLAAVPIVALLSFLIGVVVAYMGAQQLRLFGAEIYVINLVEITTLRELGVLMTSIVVAGRSGSAFTAQIGAMQANEEVDAMRTMGLDPMRLLVQPRVVALILMLPALVFLSDIMGLLGGAVAVKASIGLGIDAFSERLQASMNLNHFYIGLGKAPVFALIIGVVGCFQGFRVTGSSDSVGRLTTQAVVQAIFLVIVFDAAFAVFFAALGV